MKVPINLYYRIHYCRTMSYNMIELTIAKICELLEVSIDGFKSKSRKRELVEARAVFYKVMRESTSISFPEIGRIMNKNHSTVIHGCKLVENIPTIYKKYDKVRNYL